MCLEKIRIPTEEERNKVHIGYKIVQKGAREGQFKPTISKVAETTYKIGKETLASRDHTYLHQNEIDESEVYEGIHFYTDPEIEKYPFKLEEDYSLIKIEIQGQDLIAFGEGPCPSPRPSPHLCLYRCLYLYLYQGVATKIKVLEEVKVK